MDMTPRLPVTVLTGFLGSGKTTLLDRTPTEDRGRRIAVVDNAFGEVGVDRDLLGDAAAPGASMASTERVFNPEHLHADTVGSLALALEGEIDAVQLDAWPARLLQRRGQDCSRTKGVDAVAGEAERFAFPGVHMLFDVQPGDPPGDPGPSCRRVFMGRNLDEAALDGFRSYQAA